MSTSELQRESSTERRNGPYRVVVADDSAAVRVLLGTVLSIEGDFELVREATDGEEAVAAVEAERPDLLVLDLAMPSMDGLQVLEQLRAKHEDVAIVVYSGYGTPALRKKVRELGAADYVEKGVPPNELVERLRAACGTRP